MRRGFGLSADGRRRITVARHCAITRCDASGGPPPSSPFSGRGC